MFPTQIIVTGELNKKEHIWLSSLSNKMRKQDMKELFNRIHQLENRFDRELADSVLEVSIGANKEVVDILKGDDIMCQALMEIMEPEISLREKELEEAALQRGMQKGIQTAINMLRNFGHQDTEIKTTLIKEYDLSAEEIEKYFQ